MSMEISWDNDTDESELMHKRKKLEEKRLALLDQINSMREEERKLSDELVIVRREIFAEERRKEQEEKERKIAEAKRKLAEQEKAAAEELRKTVEELNGMQLDSWNKAHDFQKEDVASIFHDFRTGESHGFFNANDMGLGKTIETILTIQAIFKKKPKAKVLWLTKSQILTTGSTWREFKHWAPELTVVPVMGSELKDQREFKIEILGSVDNVVLLTNYETVRTTKSLQKGGYDIVVMDEVHKLKGGANPSGPTGIWTSVRNFCWDINVDEGIYTPKVDYIIMLSGTPMVNRVAEMWAYLHIFDPMRFPKMKNFETAFGVYKDLGGKVDTSRILNMCLKDRMIRRERDEVGIELPPIQVIWRDIQYNDEQQKIYNQMKEQFFIWLEDTDEVLTATAIIAQLTRLRQISCWPVFTQEVKNEDGVVTHTVDVCVEDSAKVDEAMDIIEEHGDQVVVCCNFNNVFDEIKKRCDDMGLSCGIINGATKKADMNMLEVAFQNNEMDVLCINTIMGEGLNLQKSPGRWPGGSNLMIHLDKWWNQSREDQANARIHRQGEGQDTSQPVAVYMLHNPNSVDAFITQISDEKAEQISGVMDSDKIRPKAEWKKLLGDVL